MILFFFCQLKLKFPLCTTLERLRDRGSSGQTGIWNQNEPVSRWQHQLTQESLRRNVNLDFSCQAPADVRCTIVHYQTLCGDWIPKCVWLEHLHTRWPQSSTQMSLILMWKKNLVTLTRLQLCLFDTAVAWSQAPPTDWELCCFMNYSDRPCHWHDLRLSNRISSGGCVSGCDQSTLSPFLMSSHKTVGVWNQRLGNGSCSPDPGRCSHTYNL